METCGEEQKEMGACCESCSLGLYSSEDDDHDGDIWKDVNLT